MAGLRRAVVDAQLAREIARLGPVSPTLETVARVVNLAVDAGAGWRDIAAVVNTAAERRPTGRAA